MRSRTVAASSAGRNQTVRASGVVEPLQRHGFESQQALDRAAEEGQWLAGPSDQRAVFADGMDCRVDPVLEADLQTDALVLGEHLLACRKVVGRARQGRAVEGLAHSVEVDRHGIYRSGGVRVKEKRETTSSSMSCTALSRKSG